MNSRAEIYDFLAQKRIAVIGVSRNPKDFSHTLFQEFVARGYDVVAVNPNTDKLNGCASFARIEDVAPAPDAVLLVTPHAVSERILQNWKASIRHVWIYGYRGQSTVSPGVISGLENAGVGVVNGECPYMFLEKSGGIHRFHGFIRKVFHSYPT